MKALLTVGHNLYIKQTKQVGNIGRDESDSVAERAERREEGGRVRLNCSHFIRLQLPIGGKFEGSNVEDLESVAPDSGLFICLRVAERRCF